MHPSRVIVAVTLTALLVASCSGDDPEAAPSTTTSPVASPSPRSPSPSPSPSPIGPPAPLTGVPVLEEVLDRPALTAKVENTAAARPQAGLEDADVVVEELVEGGITRFLAVFQSTVPDEIGPIRSARLVDAELLPAFDGILLYSGARAEVEAVLAGTALRITEGAPGVYRRSGRRAPSNLWAVGPAVYETALERDADLGPPPSGFVFADDPGVAPVAGADGTTIDIPFSRVVTTSWEWDAPAGVYRRSQDGDPQETVSGEPVGAANVVLASVTTFSGGCCDTSGASYVVSRTTGEGRAVVLRDGGWFEARWVRDTADDPWRLVVEGGGDLPLAAGPTWLHLVPSARMPPVGGTEPSDDDATDAAG